MDNIASYLNDKVGLGTKLPVAPWDSLCLFCYHQGVVNGSKIYDEFGLHMKMGVVYVIAVVAILLYGLVSGVYDLQTVLQQLNQYWGSLASCPFN